MANGKQSTQPSRSQQTCIDLPGEQVQCWRSSDKLTVILRKHRDVILEMNLGKDKKYTVESTGSDFYHADAKKLIAGRGGAGILFNDGERLHLWISRDFKGEFLLKSSGQVMMKFEPQQLDAQQYGRDPSIKPVPIIVALGSSANSSELQSPKPGEKAKKQGNQCLL